MSHIERARAPVPTGTYLEHFCACQPSWSWTVLSRPAGIGLQVTWAIWSRAVILTTLGQAVMSIRTLVHTRHRQSEKKNNGQRAVPCGARLFQCIVTAHLGGVSRKNGPCPRKRNPIPFSHTEQRRESDDFDQKQVSITSQESKTRPHPPDRGAAGS